MRAIAAAVLAAVLVLVPASAASAAGVVELSDDGSTWSTSLGGPLFATAPQLVPLGSQSASFWVRNSAAAAAYLTLTVDNLSWSGSHYASALSVAASVPGTAGTPLALASSSGCVVLLDGILLAAGQSVQVTATLALGDLNGTAGQSGSAAMDFGVLLEQASSSAPAPGCNPAAAPTTVVVIPPSSTRPAASAAETSAQSTPAAGGAEAETPAPSFVPGASILTLVANTLAQFDSSVLGWAGAGVPLGAALFFLVGVVRRLIRGPGAIDDKELPS